MMRKATASPGFNVAWMRFRSSVELTGCWLIETMMSPFFS